MDTCRVDGCSKPVRANGFCRPHNMRNWRHGDPLAGSPERGHARQFLIDNVKYEGDSCLIWPFARNAKGYPDVKFKGFEGMLAHRVMCVLAHGEPPQDKMDAAHSCGNGQQGCVNPNHLSWKTRIENHQDKKQHGTQIWGEKIHFHKLTLEQARRAKYGGERVVDLIKEFNVTRTCIHNIRSNKTWKGI